MELATSSAGCTLLRNNSGAQTIKGRLVRWGLGNRSKEFNAQTKSSDLIGWTPVVITQDMVGKTVAVFTAMEVKPVGFIIKTQYNEGTREWAQENFCQTVRDAGGFAGFVTSGDDLRWQINYNYQRLLV